MEVARAESERGELVLQAAHGGGRVDDAGAAGQRGVRDGHPGDVERAGAGSRGAGAARGPEQVLVGGLGLGFTLAEVLADPRVRRVVVAEIEPALVGWLRDGTVPHGPALLADDRVEVVVADVARRHRRRPTGAFDLVLLDVDNGPGYLVHDANAALYGPGLLRTTGRAMRPDGLVRDLVRRPRPGPARRAGRGVRRRRGDGVRRRPAGPGRAVLASPGAGTFDGVNDSPAEYRVEHDSMGEVRVPRDALWRAQTQRAVENFPISGQPLEPALDPRAGPHQGRRGPHQRRARVPDHRAGGRHHRGHRSDRRRRARRPVPDRRLPDRLGHQHQHERQRGHRHPRPAAGRRGAPQRPRERRAVLQRHLPLRHPRRRRARHPRPPRRHRPAARVADGQERRVRRRREVRPYAPDGRHAGDAGSGAGRVRRRRRPRPRAHRGRPPPRARASAGWNRRRHRHQRAGRVRRADDRPAQRGHRRAVHRGPRPLRGPGRARRDRRAERRPPHVRRRAGEDLQRPALDGQRPDHRPGRDPPAPTSSRGRASCPARSTRSSPRRR